MPPRKSKVEKEKKPEKEKTPSPSTDTRPEEAIYSYFIGRLNPPHSGHIKTIMNLLMKTIAHKQESIHSKALILLGSGPDNQQTQDNPISFELKKEFLVYKLSEELVSQGVQYALEELCDIQQKSSPTQDACVFVERETAMLSPKRINKVTVIHYAGDKDDDAKKLSFIHPFIRKTLEKRFSPHRIEVTTASIEAEAAGDSAMSATKVRKDVYHEEYAAWKKKYGDFYGDFSQPIYDAIKSKEDVVYVAPKKSTKKSKPKAKGGNTRRVRR